MTQIYGSKKLHGRRQKKKMKYWCREMEKKNIYNDTQKGTIVVNFKGWLTEMDQRNDILEEECRGRT